MQLVLTGTHDASKMRQKTPGSSRMQFKIFGSTIAWNAGGKRTTHSLPRAGRALFTVKNAKTVRMASRAPDPPQLLALSSHGR